MIILGLLRSPFLVFKPKIGEIYKINQDKLFAWSDVSRVSIYLYIDDLVLFLGHAYDDEVEANTKYGRFLFDNKQLILSYGYIKNR